jgi:hypothetical protein
LLWSLHLWRELAGFTAELVLLDQPPTFTLILRTS